MLINWQIMLPCSLSLYSSFHCLEISWIGIISDFCSVEKLFLSFFIDSNVSFMFSRASENGSVLHSIIHCRWKAHSRCIRRFQCLRLEMQWSGLHRLIAHKEDNIVRAISFLRIYRSPLARVTKRKQQKSVAPWCVEWLESWFAALLLTTPFFLWARFLLGVVLS